MNFFFVYQHSSSSEREVVFDLYCRPQRSLRLTEDNEPGEMQESDRASRDTISFVNRRATAVYSSLRRDYGERVGPEESSAARRLAAASSGDVIPTLLEPLLEMGFTRRHIRMALRANSGHEAVNDRMNAIVTWLLEHPLADEEVRIPLSEANFQYHFLFSLYALTW